MNKTTRNVASGVRNGATRIAGEAGNAVAQAMDAAEETAVSSVRDGRKAASDYVVSLRDAADAAAGSLEADGCGRTASQARKASVVLDEVGNAIADYDVQDLVSETADALRRRPALAFSLAALAGYALVRLPASDGRSRSSREVRS
ncbi:MAG: hypothetical protein V2I51_17055 [Anderseniella sp.]|jgi:hypothetical protein|nr:hypothetical protein [Anderseniella sp.]